MQNAAALTWPGTATTLSVDGESDTCTKRCTRESVTYEDEDAPSLRTAADQLIVRGKCYEFDPSRVPPARNWMHGSVSARYDVVENCCYEFVLCLFIPCVPKKVSPLTFCSNNRKSAPI